MSYYNKIPQDVKLGDKFILKHDTRLNGTKIDYDTYPYSTVNKGVVLELKSDVNTDSPAFWFDNKSNYNYFNWGAVEPLNLFNVGDIVQFVNEDGVPIDAGRMYKIGISNTSQFSEAFGLFRNSAGSYGFIKNEGVIKAVENGYAMVEWEDKAGQKPCIAFNLKNLKKLNNDVQTVIGTRSEECTSGEPGISSSGVKLAIASGCISYTEINCSVGATCETSQIGSTISIL